MKVSIYNTDGTKSKNSVELNDEIFAIEPNEVVIYEDVPQNPKTPPGCSNYKCIFIDRFLLLPLV